jgi:hypothetical protein
MAAGCSAASALLETHPDQRWRRFRARPTDGAATLAGTVQANFSAGSFVETSFLAKPRPARNASAFS